MPYFTHDCDDCTFVGSGLYHGQPVDVYVACDKSSHTHILRFGVDGDYMTTDRAQDEVVYQRIKDINNAKVDRMKAELNDARQERENLHTRLNSLNDTITALQTKILFIELSAE